jgi:hypothetical protein
MSRPRADELWIAGANGLLGAGLLAIVFLVPDAGRDAGKSFVQIALGSSWEDLGDLAAAWCSLKMIFLCLSLFLLSNSLSRALESFRREVLAATASFVGLLSFFGAALGMYELIKALL